MQSSNIHGTFYEGFDTHSAFDFYESIRDNLPRATYPESTQYLTNLLEIVDKFDVFVFDAYGVLNVGSTAIVGAPECVAQLRKMGKSVFVLTNAATLPPSNNVIKFEKLGYDFSKDEVISSRLAAQEWLSKQKPKRWGVMGKKNSDCSDFNAETILLEDDPLTYEQVEGFLFLSTWEWNQERQSLLDYALRSKPRPVIVANPDVIAPFENKFSTEPGFIGHRIAQKFGTEVTFHGKPFPSVFEIVEQRIGLEQERSRIAMIGDTLHTDVLGGASRGWSTVLVKDHGLFRGEKKVQKFFDTCGIIPTYCVPSI